MRNETDDTVPQIAPENTNPLAYPRSKGCISVPIPPFSPDGVRVLAKENQNSVLFNASVSL